VAISGTKSREWSRKVEPGAWIEGWGVMVTVAPEAGGDVGLVS
jgi:hypothetical protein